MNDLFDNLKPLAHNAWRIALGFTFFTHGGQKIFAWFGREESVELMTRFGIAGLIEVTAGILIILGLFTRLAAFVASGEMAVAYFWVHVIGRDSLWFWANGGELAVVYCFSFLLMATIGAGSFSLDARMKQPAP